MKYLTMMLALALVAPVSVALPSPHGYKWIFSTSDYEKEYGESWNEVNVSNIDGWATEMMFLNLTGIRNGTLLLDFIGGNLVDIDAHIEGRNSTDKARVLDYRIYMDMNYSGSMLISEVSYYFPGNSTVHRYYGIRELWANVSGIMRTYYRDAREGGWLYYMEKNSSVGMRTFHITFSPALPFYPTEKGNWSLIDTIRMEYWGNRTGFMDFRAHYPSGLNDSLRAYVGRPIHGYDAIDVSADFFSNGTMFCPSVLGINAIVDIEPYKGYMRDFDDSAFTRNFWQRYDENGIASMAQKQPFGPLRWSENASYAEVMNYLENKSAYIPVEKEPENLENGQDYTIYYAGAAILILSWVSVWAFFRIRKD